MKENDQFILDIKRLGINGEGIGFYNKLAVFVEGAIPGEGHEISITKCDNTFVTVENETSINSFTSSGSVILDCFVF